MKLVIALFGLLIVAFGVFGIAAPGRLVAWVSSVWKRDLLWFAVTFRLVLGGVLIYAAPECRFPLAIRVLGFVSVAAAVGILAVGSERVRGFVGWWTERPPGFVRAWCAAGLLFGAFLVYAAV